MSKSDVTKTVKKFQTILVKPSTFKDFEKFKDYIREMKGKGYYLNGFDITTCCIIFKQKEQNE
jgi:hypothetical protein